MSHFTAVLHYLLLADEPLLCGTLDVVPGEVHPPELDTVVQGPPRGAHGGGLPPVVVVPGRPVIPDPGPVSLREGSM